MIFLKKKHYKYVFSRKNTLENNYYYIFKKQPKTYTYGYFVSRGSPDLDF